MTASAASGLKAGPAARFYAIDWLRIVALLAVFLFHVAHLFDLAASANDLTNDPTPGVRNSESSVVLSGYVFFAYHWMMPLLFLLAGMTACGSLRSRRVGKWDAGTSGAATGSFFLRVPDSDSPGTSYVSVLNHGTFRGSFLSYHPIHLRAHLEGL